jgi:lipoprotein-anchoring transpeptidase ErfK/SrfK
LLTKVGIALVILLLATFSTARAHQVWSTQQAQDSVRSARASATAALDGAVSAGLTTTELAAQRAQLAALQSEDAPSGSPLWNSAAPRFYADQERHYLALVTAIHTRVAQTTRSARSSLALGVSALSKTVAAADPLRVPADAATTVLTSSKAVSGDRASSLSALRAAMQKVQSANSVLTSANAAREAQLSSIETAANNDLPTLQGQADSAASAARSELDLLTVVAPRDATLGTHVSADATAVRAATTLQDAALKMLSLDDSVAAVKTAYAKDLPAKVIVISTEDQEATMYESGKVVYSTPVTTGGPELPTDHGVFHIYEKISPFVFHSPFPVGSPYYYDPSPVSFWMPFDGQEGLHDASWRTNYGPGTNLQPTDLGGGRSILGTHGCVNLPYAAAQFVWDWAPLGTTVAVI